MSLLHPTPGELLDRLLIVRLKIEHAPTDELRARFQKEAEELTAVLDPAVWGLTLRGVVEYSIRLHQWLWDANLTLEQASRTSSLPDPSLAVAVWRINNQRLLFVAQVDRELGCYQGPEKLYAEFL